MFAKRTENITNYSLLLTLAYTGMRRGELMGIKWNNIDFDEKTLPIERTRDYNGERDPKSKNSKRTIFIDELLISQLKVYRTWCKKIMLTYGQRWSEFDYCFHFGETRNTDYRKVCIRINQTNYKKSNLKSITPRGLRHTHATIMLGKKVPLKTIADRLGNTPEMV